MWRRRSRSSSHLRAALRFRPASMRFMTMTATMPQTRTHGPRWASPSRRPQTSSDMRSISSTITSLAIRCDVSNLAAHSSLAVGRRAEAPRAPARLGVLPPKHPSAPAAAGQILPSAGQRGGPARQQDRPAPSCGRGSGCAEATATRGSRDQASTSEAQCYSAVREIFVENCSRHVARGANARGVLPLYRCKTNASASVPSVRSLLD